MLMTMQTTHPRTCTPPCRNGRWRWTSSPTPSGSRAGSAARGCAAFHVANQRLSKGAGPGQVMLKLKTLWRDGTTHMVMPPLAFMQRLAALVPRPRLHLIRFHGVLSPNAKLRAQVVPQEPEPPA